MSRFSKHTSLLLTHNKRNRNPSYVTYLRALKFSRGARTCNQSYISTKWKASERDRNMAIIGRIFKHQLGKVLCTNRNNNRSTYGRGIKRKHLLHISLEEGYKRPLRHSSYGSKILACADADYLWFYIRDLLPSILRNEKF